MTASKKSDSDRKNVRTNAMLLTNIPPIDLIITRADAECIRKGNGYTLYLKSYLYPHVHRNIIYHSPGVETN